MKLHLFLRSEIRFYHCAQETFPSRLCTLLQILLCSCVKPSKRIYQFNSEYEFDMTVYKDKANTLAVFYYSEPVAKSYQQKTLLQVCVKTQRLAMASEGYWKIHIGIPYIVPAFIMKVIIWYYQYAGSTLFCKYTIQVYGCLVILENLESLENLP